MSTQQPITKMSGAVLFLSGAYLFFITLVIAPFLNIGAFSTLHSMTKLLLVASAGIISALQLYFLVPRIPLVWLRRFGNAQKFFGIVSLLALVLSVALSASPRTSLFGMFTQWESNSMIFLVYGLIAIAWYVYFVVLRTFTLDKTVFTTLVVLATIVVIAYALGEYYIWGPSTGYNANAVSRISLGFKNPLLAAYFLGMLWSFSATRLFEALVEYGRRTWKEAVFGLFEFVLFAGVSLALVLTFTRSAWIAAGLSLAVTIVVKLLSSYRQARVEGTLRYLILRNIVGILIISFSLSFLGLAFRNEINLRNSDLTVESQNTLATIAQSLGKVNQNDALVFYQQADTFTSADIRLLEWKWGVRTWLGSVKNIFLGTGFDAGFFEMPKYRDPIFNNFPTDAATKPFYVRNIYINFLMQAGIVLFSSVVILVIWLGKKLLPIAAQELSATTIVVAFLTQGIFYYSSYLPTVLLLFALAYLLAQLGNPSMLLLRQPNTSERVLLITIAAVILLWIVPIAKAEYYINQYTVSGLPSAVESMAEHAQTPINNNVLKRFLVYHYSDTAQAQLYLPELATSNDVDDLRIAGDAYYVIARKTESAENAEKSIEAIQRLLAIDPTLPATWDSLGLRYLFVGRFSEAREAFMKSLSLKNDYWYAYLHLGEVSRQQCNPKEALDWYKKAEQYVPSAANEIEEAKREIRTPRTECKQ